MNHKHYYQPLNESYFSVAKSNVQSAVKEKAQLSLI